MKKFDNKFEKYFTLIFGILLFSIGVIGMIGYIWNGIMSNHNTIFQVMFSLFITLTGIYLLKEFNNKK